MKPFATVPAAKSSPATKKPAILVINGSLGGRSGNTSGFLEFLREDLRHRARVREVVLAEKRPRTNLKRVVASSDGFIFATGTYWDSWGSPMQAFLEESTEWEGSSVWLGKPAAVVVTMHSVGGKEVLSRLQGVLSTLGCLIPPMSGMCYSLSNHLALESPASGFNDDLWQPADLSVISLNLLAAVARSSQWVSWPTDKKDPRRRWL